MEFIQVLNTIIAPYSNIFYKIIEQLGQTFLLRSYYSPMHATFYMLSATYYSF